jgi:elongation factor P--(R)-beta-lysine ligase
MKTWEKIKQNPEIIQKYLVREKVVDTIRDFFKKDGFHEVQTPTLVPMPSTESNLEVFETQLRTSKNPMGKRAFLITSPEYALKKLIAAGVGSVFEITRSFRNEEEITSAHNPEFTILEWYRVGADYMKIAEDFEKLFLEIIIRTYGSNKTDMTYMGEQYDLSLPWPRISFEEAFLKFAGKKVDEVKDEDFYQIFFNDIEPKLRASHKPAFVYDYPISQAALARRKSSDGRFAERWEVFLAGVELGNCFSELTDAVEQEKRLANDLTLRQAQGKTEYPMDKDFIEALKSGMPECAGVAVGVDRLIMLAADVPAVSETLFFPAGELW